MDLAEAEGRLLRRHATRLTLAAGLAAVSAVIGLLAMAMMLAALWLWVHSLSGSPALASLCVGVLGLVLAGSVLWTAMKYLK